ncbi:MAG: AmmeMemoRadiSam system protein B [Thaumarchaeota archaeon]|nr:AmmeMemoRadiSam system protein B [Nitrososphaerota archaeon]
MGSTNIDTRPAAVAGQFYPSDRDELYEIIHWSFTHPLGPGRFPSKSEFSPEMERVECLIVPHAGYVYSGPVAAHSFNIAHNFFQQYKNQDQINIVILGPNHYGLGSGVAVSAASFWETPLGKFKVNSELARDLAEKSNIIDIDDASHSREHSIEVQIPFIQALSSHVKATISLLPVSLMLQDSETTKEIAEEIGGIIRSIDVPFLVLGSSDLTHYEPQESASLKDRKLLEQVQNLNLAAYYNIIERLNVSACGYGAISAVMQISKMFGKKKGNLLKYASSGDTSGDKSAVVGYSSVHFV